MILIQFFYVVLTNITIELMLNHGKLINQAEWTIQRCFVKCQTPIQFE